VSSADLEVGAVKGHECKLSSRERQRVRVNTDIAGQFSAVRDYEIGKTVVKL
jgi:hypothetical protein